MNVIGAVLNRPNQQNNADPNNPEGSDSPWLISTAAKAVGTVAGAVSCFFGFFLLLSIFDVNCLLVGALLIIEGFFMILTEAPCCCVFFEFAYMPSTLLEKRPAWVKATLYLFFAAIPFLWCTGLATFMSCGLIMATSAIYLLMALGKKANRDEMRIKTTNGQNNGAPITSPPISSAPTAVLVQNEEVPDSSDIVKGGTVLGPNNSVVY